MCGDGFKRVHEPNRAVFKPKPRQTVTKSGGKETQKMAVSPEMIRN